MKAQLVQKETVVDRYFTGYEHSRADKSLLEGRIQKLAAELTEPRRRRDQLQVHIAQAPD